MSKQQEEKKKDEEGEALMFLFSHLQLDSHLCERGERPDFKYTSPSGKEIGIEVTRCFNKGDDVCMMQNELSKTCEESEKALIQMGISGILVVVSFKDSILRSKKKTSTFLNTISKEIIHRIQYDATSWNNVTPKNRITILTDEEDFKYESVDTVSVYNNNDGRVEVRPAFFYPRQDITVEAVRNSILLKNKKLKDYMSLPCNESISEYWLLITLPWYSFTQLGYLPQVQLETDYSRIYITDSFGELQTL